MIHLLSCSAACGILPDQGSNPCLLHWRVDSLPPRHEGSPCSWLFIGSLALSPTDVKGRPAYREGEWADKSYQDGVEQPDLTSAQCSPVHLYSCLPHHQLPTHPSNPSPPSAKSSAIPAVLGGFPLLPAVLFTPHATPRVLLAHPA